jgi:hypothetical protein
MRAMPFGAHLILKLSCLTNINSSTGMYYPNTLMTVCFIKSVCSAKLFNNLS